MKRYILPYTLNSKNRMDLPQEKYNNLYIDIKENENIEEKIAEKLEEIVLNPKENNTSIQVHGVYEIANEIKLKNYSFKK
jgi:hypothetical protein